MGGSDPSLSPAATRTKGRKYGFACLACRRRKIKCDGKKPICINCTKSKESCEYKDNPAFVGYLSEELRKHKIRVQELESVIRELASLDIDARDRRIATLASGLDQRTTSSPESAYFESEDTHVGLSVSYGASAEFSVDEHGQQQYFGATSRFHALSENNDQSTNDVDTNETENSEVEDYHRRWHQSNARFQASWEKLAHANIHQYTDVDASLCSRLLEVYWTWQGPLHNYVYRRCFFRDMALGGPYFSLFLLNVIFAHACRHMPDDDPRFAPYERGEFFLKKALLLLLDEIKESKPKIPTIQGLLILGGRQCAVGKSSEGWLYTGMAIRMITDLGLHLRKGKIAMMKEYEPDDLEVRKRLYLSGYTWDKSISLCLGRPPSLPELPYHSSSMFDFSDDDDQWQPPRVRETDKTFPPTKCHSTLTFKYFCDLAEIINESYNTVYNGNSGKSHNIKSDAIFELERKLHHFHRNLPNGVRIEDTSHLKSCVPPHIMCLNILYHTMLILIFRPFFIWRWRANLRDHPLAIRAQAVCTEQAADVNEIFRAYGRLFNFQYQSYLVSYCVYTAATIDVRLMRHEDRSLAEKAADRLVVTLRMLETELKQTPGIKRSIEIIRSHLGQQRLPVLRESQYLTPTSAKSQQENDKSHHINRKLATHNSSISSNKNNNDSSNSNSNSEKWHAHEVSPSPNMHTSHSTMTSSTSPSSMQHNQRLPSMPMPINAPYYHYHHHHLPPPHTNTEAYSASSTHTSSSSNIPTESPAPVLTPGLPLALNTSNMHAFMDTQMHQIDMPWFDCDVEDSGGGFVPDMAYWGTM